MTETRELIINALSDIAWLLPEQRIGQIIYNYVCANCPNCDSFFISDEKLLEILEKVVKEYSKSVDNEQQ